MSWYRSRRGLLALLGMLLLILFVTRPGVGGLRTKIVHSISRALGRPVEISSATLRFLPQPGFDLQNFIVYDDPDFSQEPVLRSSDVTASLRLTSLLRGRLEIARLSLGEPSLNLVRKSDGHWNVEYLVARAANVPLAPTGKRADEKRPSFPYIEGSGARINFKFGIEKKQFALTDADFALFQDSENSWGLRLEAKPVRTDSNFSDSGSVKISGTWQRAAVLHETPLRMSLQWQQAQLGQVSKLIYGNDKGWRGDVSLSAEVSGTPENLAILSDARVEKFRRYDILVATPMRLRAQCGANYSSSTRTFSNIICESPVGDGSVALHGSVVASDVPSYHLALFAQDVPIQSLVALVRHSKKDIPNDLVTAGTLRGSLKVQREGTAPDVSTDWSGDGETDEFRLASQSVPSQLVLPQIHFAISSPPSTLKDEPKHRRGAKARERNLGETRVEVNPFMVGLGGQAPVTVQGWFSRTGYDVKINGDAQLRRLLRAAKTLGVPTPQPEADGETKFDLKFDGLWAGFKPARATGKVELHGVRAKVNGLSKPIDIDAANIVLDADQVNVRDLSASIGNAKWRGSLTLPRPCGIAATCPVAMDLHLDQISTDDLATLFNPQEATWYRFLMSPQKASPYLLSLRAKGKLSADRLVVHGLAISHCSTNFDLNRGNLQLTDAHAAMLGGTHVGDWQLDFTVRPPVYAGKGSFEHVALSQIAGIMQDNWITGTASATYRLTTSGSTSDELFSSANAVLKIEAGDGLLPHMLSANFTGPLQLRHFEGTLSLHQKKLDFGQSKLVTNDGSYEVNGSASLAGKLNLNLNLVRKGSHGWAIGGTLAAPLISPTAVPETQAALKP